MTKLLYLDDSTKLTFAAHVVDFFNKENKPILVLDQTAFYPQGGG